MIQVKDCRDHESAPIPKVGERKSTIHGNGAFSECSFAEGEVLLEVLLPSKNVADDFFMTGDYDCYKHIAHGDGKGVMLIDSGEYLKANPVACSMDKIAGLFRLLNHSDNPNAKILTGGAAAPEWYEPVGEGFTDWYMCSLTAKRKIKAGEEITFKYASPPEGAI